MKTTRILPLTRYSDCVWSVAVSPDGKYLANGSADKTIKIWDVEQYLNS